MADTANSQSNAGQAGLLTVIVTTAEVAAQVQAEAAAVIPPAINSVLYRVDPINRHLYRSRDGGPETDLGLVGGTRFWGPYSTVASMPGASDGVMSGDIAYNTNTQAFYVRQSGQWTSMGTLKGADATVPSPTATASVLTAGAAPTVNVSAGFAFSFGIPAGQPGTNGTTPALSIGNVTTGAAGSSATVVRRSGSPDAAPIFDFTIPRGADGATGVVAATAPLAYNATTKTVSIDLSAYATTNALSTAVAGVTLTFNAPLIKSGITVSIPAATATVDGYMPATTMATITALQTAVTALQNKSIKGGLGTKTVNVPISLIVGSQDVTIPLSSTLPDLNYLPLFGITSTTGLALSAFTVAFKSKTTNSITVTLGYPAVSALSTVTIAAFGLETA